MKPIFLVFAGGIGSGKTTLSTKMAKELGWHYLSFGNYIRSLAKKQGRSLSRASLQELGEKMIIKNGWETFCKNFLENGNWDKSKPYIIDGLRHIEVLNVFKTINNPHDVFLVFISLSYKNRSKRFLKREENRKFNLSQYESHSTEIQTNSLLCEFADLTLNGKKSINKLVKEILIWLNSLPNVN